MRNLKTNKKTKLVFPCLKIFFGITFLISVAIFLYRIGGMVLGLDLPLEMRLIQNVVALACGILAIASLLIIISIKNKQALDKTKKK